MRGGDIDLLIEMPQASADRWARSLARESSSNWVCRRSTSDVEAWIEVRRLRNRMIHAYVRDPAERASALRVAHAAVPLLADAAAAMALRVMAGPENPEHR